jgi:hypothetical protein
VSPGPGEVIGRAGVATDLPAHVPPAPCPGPTRIMLVTARMVVMVVVMVTVRPSLCFRSNEAKHSHCSQESTQIDIP